MEGGGVEYGRGGGFVLPEDGAGGGGGRGS